MSLCIAWRWDQHINFASDSRITLAGGEHTSDLGIKIAGVPVRIATAEDATTRKAELRFSATYGIAFAGSYLAGFVIREMLSEVLQSLQFIADADQMTIERLMKVVYAFHAHYTKTLRKSFNFGHDLDFLIGGRCPASGVVKVFRFISTESEAEPQYEEVLTKLPFSYTAIGAGEGKFRRLFESDLPNPRNRVHFSAFSRLRDVINDDEIPSVGGKIQTGSFENGEFKHYGMLEHDLSGDAPIPLPSVRGLVLEEAYKPTQVDDFYIRSDFRAPFEADLEALFKRL